MNRRELEELLEEIRRVRIAVLGDFALDAYWFIDESGSELSLETGKPTRRVARQSYSLGGAGNVCNNLADLGTGTVMALGVVGDDPFGRELLRLLQAKRVNTEHMLAQPENWETITFGKPHVGNVEQSRLDFGHFSVLAEPTAAELIARLAALLPSLNAVIINQQVQEVLHGRLLRERLSRFVLEHPQNVFLVDSRDCSDSYPGACLKVNEKEAVRLVNPSRDPAHPISDQQVIEATRTLFAARRKPVFVTRGARGCLVYDERGLHEVPAVPVPPPIDPVGAGDSMVAGIAAALAAGRDAPTAAQFGALVAAVTVKKLFQTGTATPAEILALVAS